MAGNPQVLSRNAFVSFAVFGAYWGAWGASIPRIQHQAGLDDGQLGVALLFVGAGALPAMVLLGPAIDRVGLKVTAAVLPAMCAAGAVMALTATNLPTLSAGLAVVGAASGASDVAINSVAGQAEASSGGAVISRAHGIFSGSVVIASLGTGACSAAALPVAAPFLAIAAASLVAAWRLVRTLPGPAGMRRRGRSAATEPTGAAARPRQLGLPALVLLGGLGALAFAGENAHQSWSAVFVHDVLHAGTGVAAGAPALFAAIVAVSRFSVSRVPFRHARTVLLAGAAVAALGAAIVSAAGNLVMAAFGLTTAAVGTAVLFPTLMRLVSRNVDDARRGRATSVVTFVSYLGFLLGPVYMGFWADHAGLRVAMLATGALAVALLALTVPVLKVSTSSGATGILRATPTALHGQAPGRGLQRRQDRP